jgi:PTH1 family peptidyl-tRNA hydrolase
MLHCIVGLGNPGRLYQNTRHNLGYNVVLFLAEKYHKRFRRFGKSLITEVEIQGRKTLLALPLTFMNESGQAVLEIINKKHINIEDLLIVLDDVFLPLGKVRIRKKGSSGGHNGLQSVIDQLGTQDIPRLRIGIGPKPNHISLERFVLMPMTKEEIRVDKDHIENAAKACQLWRKNEK